MRRKKYIHHGSRIERNEQKVTDWRYDVAQVRAINQDKLMINKLVSALCCPLLLLLSIVYLRTNYRPPPKHHGLTAALG